MYSNVAKPVKCHLMKCTGTSAMIPSKDIDEDIQSSLNRQSTFQGAQFEPDSSPMRVHSTEGTKCVSLCACVCERMGVMLYCITAFAFFHT